MLDNIQKGSKLEATSAQEAWKKEVKIAAMRKNRRLVWKNKNQCWIHQDSEDKGVKVRCYNARHTENGIQIPEKGIEKRVAVISKKNLTNQTKMEY